VAAAAVCPLATTVHERPGQVRSARLVAAGSNVHGYRIGEAIASGGFGTVYRAVGPDGRPVALKVLHAELASHRSLLRRFALEARTLELIRHPNVVHVEELGHLEDGRPYFVMELLEGADLATHLRARGRLPVAEAMAILRPLCDALDAAHDLGIVHRDVKASNVFLAAGGRVVLLDFGVAKLLDGQGEGLTVSRAAVGTPYCMAPEQMRGEPVDPRADVYALGTLAFHMLTGEPPFEADSTSLLAALHLHARRPLVSTRAGLPAAVDTVINRALAADRGDRPLRAGQLLAELEAALFPPQVPEAIAAHAHGIHIQVQADGLDEPDDRLLDDLESVLPTAVHLLAQQGFLPAFQAGNAALLVRPQPADPAAEQALRAELPSIVAPTEPEQASRCHHFVEHHWKRIPLLHEVLAVLSRSSASTHRIT
jgi:serine/threonine-protein kinase